MPTPTTGSVNIAELDSRIIADLCAGTFHTDITPSVYIGSGANNILGASLKITNPYNVIIKDFPTSGYDIYAPLTGVIDVSVPTQASNYQYGSYVFEIQLTDADGTIYSISKTVSICAPDSKNKTRKYGTLSAQLNGSCKDGKVVIIADNVPTYSGVISDSQVNDFVLEYPTSSGLAELTTQVGNFSTVLFEGVYKFTGTICADYSFGDSIYVKVNYKVKREKNIRCLLDEECIYTKLAQLDAQTKSDCTDAEKKETQDIIVGALRLVKTIEVAANAGFDASDYIDELESLLGCVCTCNCADGTPIINNSPAKDFAITGCNVTKTTVGLTDSYVINNYSYEVAVTANGGAITVSAPTLNGCVQTQTFTFNIAPIYAQIKNQITNGTEYNFWASIINSALSSVDKSCLSGATDTFAQLIQSIINQTCEGADCNALISTNSAAASAANVVLTWTNVSGVFESAIYMDNILVGTVLSPSHSFTIVGAADGSLHSYTIIAKCINGSIGNGLTGTFTYFGCPLIAVPTVSSNNISGATCPYNLTALVTGLPVGITAEWHNLNNTNSSSLTATPAAASDGTYYVFAKDSNGCYSLGVQVTLVCSSTTNCSAPQSLIVEAITSANRIRFQSAAFPPPLNSYTVKRRLKSDPDVSGSYTTIGTPTWNATVNRWEISDSAAINNTLYTYRAISNCTSTAPYADYDFANLDCPAVTLTPGSGTLDYSFTNVGGSVDKYEVKIYDASGITLIHTDTVVPAFTTPITGTFFYLDDGSTYNVRVRVYIGTYFTDCPFTASTTAYNYTLSPSYNMSIYSVTGTGVPSPALAPTGISGNKYGHHTAMSGVYSITLTGTPSLTVHISIQVNGVQVDCINVSGAGTYASSSLAAILEADDFRISIDIGTC